MKKLFFAIILLLIASSLKAISFESFFNLIKPITGAQIIELTSDNISELKESGIYSVRAFTLENANDSITSQITDLSNQITRTDDMIAVKHKEGSELAQAYIIPDSTRASILAISIDDDRDISVALIEGEFNKLMNAKLFGGKRVKDLQ